MKRHKEKENKDNRTITIRRRRISYGKREDFSIFEKIYDGYCADSGNFVFYMENRGKNATSTEC